MRSFSIDLRVFIVLFIAHSAGMPNSSTASADHLPTSLHVALSSDVTEIVSFVRWSALRNHPVMQRLIDMNSDSTRIDLNQLSVLWTPPIEVTSFVPFPATEIEAIWTVVNHPDPLRFRAAWIQTRLTEEQLTDSLKNAGWIAASNDDLTTYFPPLDKEDYPDMAWLERHEHLRDDEYSEAFLRYALGQKRRIEILSEGWVALVSPRNWLSRIEPETEPTLGFPFDRLHDDAAYCLAAIAFVLPEREKQNDESEIAALTDVGSLDPFQLEHRRRQLQDAPEKHAFAYIPDMLVSVFESDGGMSIEFEGRVRSSTDARVAAAFIDSIVALMRLTMAYAGQGLFHELGNVHIDVHQQTIFGHLNLTNLSLLEAIDTEGRRRKQIALIDQRQRELEEERQRTLKSGDQ